MEVSGFCKVAGFHLQSAKQLVLCATVLYLSCALHVLVRRALHTLVHLVSWALSASVTHFKPLGIFHLAIEKASK